MPTALEKCFTQAWFEYLSRLGEVELEYRDTDDPALRFSVPRIVCIGEESSGKSSTLERIAMMPVFPSDETLCTRVPIELKLRYMERSSLPEEFRESGYVVMRLKPGPSSTVPADVSEPMLPDEVAKNVKTWMENLVATANGRLTGVAYDTIIIEMYSSRQVNLDLIDLPGIVAGSIPGEPSDMMQQTRDLSASYLNDSQNPHTFVIAVASARDARIRNSQAMELVQRFNKIPLTIGALTMADLSADPRRADRYDTLRRRLNAEADDTPHLGLGYVALKNRDTVAQMQPSVSLESWNNDEKSWFEANLPECTHLCGIDNLVDRLVSQLETYIKGPWLQAERARLSSEIQLVRNALKKLGTFLPSDLNELINYYKGSIIISSMGKWRAPSFSALRSLCYLPTLGPDECLCGAKSYESIPFHRRGNPAAYVRKDFQFDISIFDTGEDPEHDQWTYVPFVYAGAAAEFSNGLNRLMQQDNSDSVYFAGIRAGEHTVLGFFFTRYTSVDNVLTSKFMNIVETAFVPPQGSFTVTTQTSNPFETGSRFVPGKMIKVVKRRSLRKLMKIDGEDKLSFFRPAGDEYYQKVLSVRKKLMSRLENYAASVCSAIINAFVCDLKMFDARFQDFIQAVCKTLQTWSDNVVRNVKDKFGTYLRNVMISDCSALFEALVSKSTLSFTNPLTTEMRELVLFEVNDYNVVDFFTSSKMVSVLRSHLPDGSDSLDSLLVESCALEREKSIRKLDSLVVMKNALQDVFQSDAPSTPGANSGKDSEENSAVSAPVSPSGSRSDVRADTDTDTRLPEGLASAMSRTTL